MVKNLIIPALLLLQISEKAEIAKLQNNARNQYNKTAQSAKETGVFSDVKSAANNNISSEYSFYDRGFKEYEYNPLNKKIRPLTAGVRREDKYKQK
mmetsp:Transcript_5716/g.4915  ORF Transcript_5716/g.4915 Transcript_5716/m.4915 type:complete len:96 (+) Transcript_5716:320-607(+)